MKTCSRCGETKALNLFPVKNENKDGRHSHCKSCRAIYDKARYNSKNRSEAYQANLQNERAKRRKYYQENKVDYYANKSKRRAATLQRTPKWLNACHFMVMRSYYSEAKYLREKGFDCEVDHIVPLQGSNVLGLHVPWNLQIIEKSKNRSKGNRYGKE
jgi:5-methylcytosine-specific restriction endonuclease McrA